MIARLPSLFRGVGRNALDLPVAGLAALASAFGVFAMPEALLSRIVGASGLPSILAAAQPPLGVTARIALAGGSAALTFGLVFLLLRLLDRSGMGERRAAQAPALDVEETPRVRRRDAHPDAPAPRPISAARDLGEPAPPQPPAPPPPGLSEETAPVRRDEAVSATEQEPEPARPEPLPSTLSGLMERLELGLARRHSVPADRPSPAAPPKVFPEASDARLRSAIDSLQRLAARSS